jgi:hypothetical protein
VYQFIIANETVPGQNWIFFFLKLRNFADSNFDHSNKCWKSLRVEAIEVLLYLFNYWVEYVANESDLIYILYCRAWVSEWLLLNANSAIFQLYYGENKLIFNEMMMRSALF